MRIKIPTKWKPNFSILSLPHIWPDTTKDENGEHINHSDIKTAWAIEDRLRVESEIETWERLFVVSKKKDYRLIIKETLEGLYDERKHIKPREIHFGSQTGKTLFSWN